LRVRVPTQSACVKPLRQVDSQVSP